MKNKDANKKTSGIKVEMSEHGRGRVFIDGEEVEGVIALQFSTRANGKNVLLLELCADRLEISGPGEVETTNLKSISRSYVFWN